MLASGITLIVLGLPCAILGVYLRGQPPPKEKGQKTGKKPKGKKGKSVRRPKEDKEPTKQGGFLSLILGGLLFSAIGAGLIVYSQMK